MIDKMINSQRVKYAILDELFKGDVLKDKDTVNIYFDMHTVISNLYRDNQSAEIAAILNDGSVVELVIGILNLAAHYRRYFHKYHGKCNKIFFILNKKIPNYNSSQMPYGHVFFDRYSSCNKNHELVNYVYEKMLTPLKEMIKGFKWMYLIESSAIEDTATIKYLAVNHPGHNIIFTKTELLYQLVNDDFMILRPSFDKTVLLTKQNLLSNYFGDVKYTPDYMTSEILPVFQTILGVRERNIDSMNIRGKVKLAKIFDKMLDGRIISNNVTIKSFIDVFMQVCQTDDSDFYDTLYYRYCAISAQMSFLALTRVEMAKINACIEDTYHDNSINEFNDYLHIKDKLDIAALNRAGFKRRGLLD